MQPWNNGTFKLDASRAAVKPVGPRPSGLAGRGPPKESTWTPSAAAPGAKKGSVPPPLYVAQLSLVVVCRHVPVSELAPMADVDIFAVCYRSVCL